MMFEGGGKIDEIEWKVQVLLKRLRSGGDKNQ